MGINPTYEELKLRISELEEQIKEHHQTIEVLKEYKERYDALFNQSLDSVIVCDLEGNFLETNSRTSDLMGYTKDEFLNLNLASFLNPHHLSQALKGFEKIKKEGSQQRVGEFKLKRKDGTLICVENNTSAIYRDGEIYATQSLVRDITKRKQMEEDLKQKWNALTNAPIGIYIVQDRNFVWVNQRFVDEIGYSEKELMGMNAMSLVIPEDRAMLTENIILMLKKQTSYPFEYRTINPNSKEARWVRGEVASTLFNGQRAVLGYYSDIDKLMMQNIKDSLTGLYNRRYILQRAEEIVDYSIRYGTVLSFIMFDVDEFKQYNDSLGHVEGDRALAEVGKIILKTIRTVDIPGRYGGEEFCVILPNTNLDDALEVAQRIRRAIEKKTKPPRLEEGVTVSVGLAESKPKGTLTDLIKNADKNLYAAKTSGKNQIVS